MKILLSWLRDYVDVGDASHENVTRISGVLTSLGLAVEGIEHVGATVPGVITARVVRTERHPDAAKVHRVYVDTGDGHEHHVWCGAFNMQVGDVLPFATLGTEMPNGMTIARRGILGIESEGMLCSALELGLGDDHSGILVLPADSSLGVPYGEVLGLAPDVLLDIDLTRNRPDCWGYVGVARDLAAGLGVEFRPPTPTLDVTGGELAADVVIVDGERCGRFTSTVLSGIVVGPSADWMARRLRAAGMRPISNVVDVSNYVMLELDQPNHAYDLATLHGPEGGEPGFRIRLAGDGETMITLDDVRRTLTADDLLICDAADRPIGVAGVMGGLDTEITDATTTVALEVAWFDPLGIMQTALRLGVRSEASARFERGVDPYGIDIAIARFVELLRETCPDLTVHGGAADARGSSLPPEHRSCEVRVAQVNRVLGTGFTAADLPPLLDPIGFTVTGTDESTGDATGDATGVVTVELPSWRPDCTTEIDVVEEIARHHGYDRLGREVPKSTVHGHLSVHQQRRRLLREVLLGLGISEAMPNPFLAPDTAVRAGLDPAGVRITNPLVAEESVLRTSLRPGLLQAVAFNESHRRSGARLFEIGHVYPPGEGELPDEYEALCVVLAGAEAPEAVAVWREVAAALGVGARLDQAAVPAGLHATRSATLSAGRDVIGTVGEIDPAVLEAFEVTERVAVLELHLDHVLDREPRPARWSAVSRSPSSDLDLAFTLDESVPAERLDKAIRQGAGKFLVELDLFDVYRGPGVDQGHRGLAYRLRLQAPDRNLTDADIAEIRQSCVAAASKLGATLRA
jgi:phenylalanyl-tRNA synthetase beta chain